MDQSRGLIFEGLRHSGAAAAGGTYSNARGEVEKANAVRFRDGTGLGIVGCQQIDFSGEG